MRQGRPPSTSRRAIADVALELFVERGFDQTTVEDIAAAAGIGRRTLFRYFASKNDIVWGDWAGELDRLRANLARAPQALALMPAVVGAVLATNDFRAADLPELRVRMQLMTAVPTLQAYSTLRYDEWRQEIAVFAAGRLGQEPCELVPQTLGYATLGVTLAAFLRWTQVGSSDLRPLLEEALGHLAAGFGDLA